VLFLHVCDGSERQSIAEQCEICRLTSHFTEGLIVRIKPFLISRYRPLPASYGAVIIVVLVVVQLRKNASFFEILLS
jgi:hypothetical protein